MSIPDRVTITRTRYGWRVFDPNVSHQHPARSQTYQARQTADQVAQSLTIWHRSHECRSTHPTGPSTGEVH